MENPKIFKKAKLDNNEFANVEKMAKIGKITASAVLAGVATLAMKNKEVIKNGVKQAVEIGVGLLK